MTPTLSAPGRPPADFAGTAHPTATLLTTAGKAERNVVACALRWRELVQGRAPGSPSGPPDLTSIATATARLIRAVDTYLEASQRLQRRLAEDTDALPRHLRDSSQEGVTAAAAASESGTPRRRGRPPRSPASARPPSQEPSEGV